MRRLTAILTLCFVGAAVAALAQDSASSSQVTQQTTTTQVSTGKVIRYEPGKTIVISGPDGREVTYMISPKIVAVPADVQVGREVSLSFEPSSSGGQTVVSRITTTSVSPEGTMKTETQTKSLSTSPSGEQTRTEMQTRSTSPSGQESEQTETKVTTITATVSAYEPGKTITFTLPDQKTVVYTIESSSSVPSDIAVGKTYTVETTTTKQGGRIVKKIVTKTTKTNP